MSDNHGPVVPALPGAPDSARRAPRFGGSLAAGVALGVALGLFAPLALMSFHIGGLFGGFVGVYPIVLAELVVGVLAWAMVGLALFTRPSQRRMGIGVLAGGAVPAIVLMVLFLPLLVPGAFGGR